jgi:hypothetical protein
MLCGMTLVHYRTNQLLKCSVNRSIQMQLLVHKNIDVLSLDGIANSEIFISFGCNMTRYI